MAENSMNLNLTGSQKRSRSNTQYSIVTLDLFKPTSKSYPEFDYFKIAHNYLVGF